MKYFFTLLLFWQIFFVKAPIPNWNLDRQSISITNFTKTIYEKNAYDIYVKLEKKIKLENGVISSKNILTYGSSSIEVDFEDIDSHYKNKYGFDVLICPKGKFHPFKIDSSGIGFLTPVSDFQIIDDWDLKCYDHYSNHFLMLYTPNGGYTFFSKCNNNCNNGNNIMRRDYVSNIYDYFLENGGEDYENNYQYRFPCLRKDTDNNKLQFCGYTLSMNNGDANVNKQNPPGCISTISTKGYTSATFDKDNSDGTNSFYYFTYNDISDFTSGYYEAYSTNNNYNYNHNGNILSTNPKVENSVSPLSFVDNVEIKEMKFIKGTKYVYYKIKNLDKNTFYYGLIDVSLNKVLYNLEEAAEITFTPLFKTGEMLFITQTTAYKICIVKNGDSCQDCSTIALDPEANICSNECASGKIKLMPEDICIEEESCDLSIYIIKTVESQKQCGLCSHFNSDEKYRFIGGEGCLNSKPNHAEFYNEKLFLLKCETDYHLDNNQCLPDNCYSRCQTCSENSNDINAQKCLSCKDNYILNVGNCIEPPTTVIIKPPITTIIPPPTTVITKIPTTIIPSPPTTLAISAPTTIKTPSPPSTVVKISPSTTIITPPPTTIVTTNVPSTMITPSPSTIINEVTEIIKAECKNKRCKECNEESDEMQLCISCDETKYKKVNYTLNQFSKYFDCKSPEQLQTKFYYDEVKMQFKPCFKHCKTCTGPGNETNQYCLQCEKNYMFRPGSNPYNNCVVYSEYYYLSPYNEYKPLNNPQCPEEAKYTIKNELNKTSCIYDCKADKEYKYLYNGNCYKSCNEIDGTSNENYICKEKDLNKIYISEKEIFLDINDNDTITTIETLAKSYAHEFNYTVNHISLFSSDKITVALYKNKSIISDTNLKLPNIDFGESYDKIKSAFNITDDIIIAIIQKNVKNNLGDNPFSSYLFFHPKTGLKLEIGDLCKNDTIEIKENLLSMLDEKSENYELQTALTKQGINIFDINDPYYKDICYDFENPKNRDMALKDRIKETYVNVTLCDDGCINTGIDVKNNVATCNCKFNDVTNSELIHENAALEYLVGEFFDLINSSNILVLKCYKNLIKYFTRSIGGIMVLIIIILNIFFSLIFFCYELTKMKRYIFTLTEKFTYFLYNYPTLVKFFPPKKKDKNNKKETKNKKHENKENENNQNGQNKKRPTINFIANYKPQINSKDLIMFNDQINLNEKVKKKEKKEVPTEDLDEGKKLKRYFKEYLSTSPDEMEYDEAIKLDKRSFCNFLLDSLEEKQSFAYTFISSDPINTRMIKFILFSLNIVLYFVVNGLFFSETFISELYHTDEKNETFFSFIPRTIDKIIYTTIVAIFIGYMTDFFFLDENKVKGIFKREKENKLILKRSITMLIREIQKRYVSFIIMTFFILVISLYYVLCFNYVYPKTQIEWVKSSILIIIVMQIMSVLKCLFETIFRFLSFKCESEKLFKFSKIFENNS